MTSGLDCKAEAREVRLQSGGSARLIEADRVFATLELEAPSPPGSTLVLLVAGAPLGVKVRSCRRVSGVESSGYEISGRFVSLSRAQRLALGIDRDA